MNTNFNFKQSFEDKKTRIFYECVAAINSSVVYNYISYNVLIKVDPTTGEITKIFTEEGALEEKGYNTYLIFTARKFGEKYLKQYIEETNKNNPTYAEFDNFIRKDDKKWLKDLLDVAANCISYMLLD